MLTRSQEGKKRVLPLTFKFRVDDGYVEDTYSSFWERIFALLKLFFEKISFPVYAQTVEKDFENDIKQCLSLEGGRDVCYASLCKGRPNQSCAESIIRIITTLENPQAASVAGHEMIFGSVALLYDPETRVTELHDDRWQGAFSIDPTFGHDLLRVVGDATAKKAWFDQ